MATLNYDLAYDLTRYAFSEPDEVIASTDSITAVTTTASTGALREFYSYHTTGLANDRVRIKKTVYEEYYDGGMLCYREVNKKKQSPIVKFMLKIG